MLHCAHRGLRLAVQFARPGRARSTISEWPKVYSHHALGHGGRKTFRLRPHVLNAQPSCKPIYSYARTLTCHGPALDIRPRHTLPNVGWLRRFGHMLREPGQARTCSRVPPLDNDADIDAETSSTMTTSFGPDDAPMYLEMPKPRVRSNSSMDATLDCYLGASRISEPGLHDERGITSMRIITYQGLPVGSYP